MIEIWMEEKKWESIREKLLKGYTTWAEKSRDF